MKDYEINKIAKNNITLTEFSDIENGEVEKIYIQNGIVGFFVSYSEVSDLMQILYYYLNIEGMSQIENMPKV